MKSKRLYACPRCHLWYSCYENKSPKTCPNCNIDPIPVNVDYSYWQKISDQERTECKRKYMQEHQSEMQAASMRKKAEMKLRPSNIIVYVMGAIILIVCVCAGIGAGFLGMVIGIIVGLTSAACLWLFSGMAEDLQVLRQSVEDLNDTLAQIKREQG